MIFAGITLDRHPHDYFAGWRYLCSSTYRKATRERWKECSKRDRVLDIANLIVTFSIGALLLITFGTLLIIEWMS